MSDRVMRFDRFAFFADLGYAPHPGQLEIHRDGHPRRVVACGSRWGKTLCAAMEALAAAVEPRESSLGWIVAPTYDLANRVFRVVFRLAHEHLLAHVVEASESEGLLVLRNLAGGKSVILTKSADNPVSLLGEGLDWVIVDEAARLKPGIWQNYLSQRLIGTKGWALLISTPYGKGYFYDLYRLGQGQDETYRSWNSPSWTNPHLDSALIESTWPANPMFRVRPAWWMLPSEVRHGTTAVGSRRRGDGSRATDAGGGGGVEGERIDGGGVRAAPGRRSGNALRMAVGDPAA